jgi:tyrosinase
MFRDTTSELYTANRNAAINNGTGSLPATDVDYGAAFAYVDFTSADATIQNTPHGDVHVDIGGLMGSVPTAAQDPIFYLHHCNIDRLWNLWLVQGGGRSDPTADAAWRGKTYTFFNESGAPVKMSGCDVLRAAQQLSYAYEGEPPQVSQYCPIVFRFPPIYYVTRTILRLPIPPVTLGSKPTSFPVNLGPLRERLVTSLAAHDETLLLEFEGVEAARQPGVVWEVYLGLPPDVAPEPKSKHFIGTLSLFGMGIRGDNPRGFMPARFTYAIKKAVEASLSLNESRVLITFVPHGILVDGGPSHPIVKSPVRIGSASIAIQVAVQRKQS